MGTPTLLVLVHHRLARLYACLCVCTRLYLNTTHKFACTFGLYKMVYQLDLTRSFLYEYDDDYDDDDDDDDVDVAFEHCANINNTTPR